MPSLRTLLYLQRTFTLHTLLSLLLVPLVLPPSSPAQNPTPQPQQQEQEQYQLVVLQQLAALDVEVMKGAQVCARDCWIEEGKSSRYYFVSLEKKRGTACWIATMRKDDRQIVASPAGLCSSFSAFYWSSFTAKPTDANAKESLFSNTESSLPPVQPESCNGLLSVVECLKALSGMAKCKAPGLDGPLAEFYLRFGMFLGRLLLTSLTLVMLLGP